MSCDIFVGVPGCCMEPELNEAAPNVANARSMNHANHPFSSVAGPSHGLKYQCIYYKILREHGVQEELEHRNANLKLGRRDAWVAREKESIPTRLVSASHLGSRPNTVLNAQIVVLPRSSCSSGSSCIDGTREPPSTGHHITKSHSCRN